jgi:hypothetical protein
MAVRVSEQQGHREGGSERTNLSVRCGYKAALEGNYGGDEARTCEAAQYDKLANPLKSYR